MLNKGGEYTLYDKVKKIVDLELKREQLNDGQKKDKINKKLMKLQSKFHIFKVRIDKNSTKKVTIYVDDDGRKVLIDYEENIDGKPYVLALNFIPSLNEQFLSFMFAIFALIVLSIVAIFLRLFGVVNEGIITSIFFVTTTASIILSIWTIFACREVVFKNLWMLGLLILMIGFNTYNAISDAILIFG